MLYVIDTSDHKFWLNGKQDFIYVSIFILLTEQNRDMMLR